MLAEIGDRVRCEVPGFQLVVAGEGPERPVLESLARSRPWMNLVGAKFGADLAAIASTASVMVIPGWVGLVVIDAAALGLPLVTTDRPEHSVEIDYLTDGVNGLICSNNAMVMGDAIAELLGDPQRLAAMSEAALELAQTATIENMCQRFGAGVLACLNGEPSPAERRSNCTTTGARPLSRYTSVRVTGRDSTIGDLARRFSKMVGPESEILFVTSKPVGFGVVLS